MSAPQETKGLPFKHRVDQLISPYGILWVFQPTAPEWKTAESKLSMFDYPADKRNSDGLIHAFVESFLPHRQDGTGHVERMSAVFRRERDIADGFLEQWPAEVAGAIKFVRKVLPFNLEVVRRYILKVAVTKDVEALQKILDEDSSNNLSDESIYDLKRRLIKFEELLRKLDQRTTPTPPSMRA